MTPDNQKVYTLVLGKVVAELRKRQGDSQETFAAKTGLTQPTLSRLERGKSMPDAFAHRQIARALGLTETELNQRVDEVMKRTEEAAAGALQEEGDGGWKTVLSVAGLVGLGGLVGFAVAALLKTWPEDPQEG